MGYIKQILENVLVLIKSKFKCAPKKSEFPNTIDAGKDCVIDK